MLKIMNRHLIFLFLFFSLLANSETFYIDSGPNSQEEVQEALIPDSMQELLDGFTSNVTGDVNSRIKKNWFTNGCNGCYH